MDIVANSHSCGQVFGAGQLDPEAFNPLAFPGGAQLNVPGNRGFIRRPIAVILDVSPMIISITIIGVFCCLDMLLAFMI